LVQYRQYQYPAGLKVVRYDEHLRAVFDKTPEPPPHGVPGADRITVLTDADADGTYDQQQDVITGLNIATSVQVGRGGIWVLNPPYLLFYPDADRDDVPDADPEVHLSGFGLQDTHAVANSLTWGPDGWLYGANGSTTKGDVSSAVTKNVQFSGQCIWRYQPGTKVFEIFAEGGGNTFSLEIDSKGRVFAGHNGGDTRGWHYPQGSYSRKNWGKHGPLTNDYAFGFFESMKLEGDPRRFAQAFCIYEGGLFPADYDGDIIAPNSLHNLVWHSERIADGSTYRTTDHADLITTPDRWFRPVYSGVGPDGAVYIADWYDTRLSHVSPVDDWHKNSGRVYRLRPTDVRPKYDSGDLHTQPAESLVSLIDPSGRRHANKWVRRRVALELGWRNERSVVPALISLVETHGSLEALWALNLMDELTTDRAGRWLQNPDADVRRWVVRLLGDRHEGHQGMALLAENETDVQVRSQLASTAKRIPAEVALPVLHALIGHDINVQDPHLPLLIWWGVEAHVDDRSAMATWLADETLWKASLFRRHLAARLMRRLAATGGREGLQRCGDLLAAADDDDLVNQWVGGLVNAFEGLPVPEFPANLKEALAKHQNTIGSSGLMLRLRGRDPQAIDEAVASLQDNALDRSVRIALATVLGEVPDPRALPALIRLARGVSQVRSTPDDLQLTAIASLSAYDDPRVADAMLEMLELPVGDSALQSAVCRTLASRPTWAMALVDAVASPADTDGQADRPASPPVPAAILQQLRAYEHPPELLSRVEATFGASRKISSADELAEIRRLRQVIAGGEGSAVFGKALFATHCGKCHELSGTGTTVGPKLDGYERGNLNFWLTAIVGPSLEIREGYQSYSALTDDGRVVTGMMAQQDDRTVTLRDAEGNPIVLDREHLENLGPIPTSLMPDDTLGSLDEQQIRDLFAFLMSTAGG